MLDYIIKFLMIQYSYLLLILWNDIKWNIFERIMLYPENPRYDSKQDETIIKLQ